MQRWRLRDPKMLILLVKRKEKYHKIRSREDTEDKEKA